MITPVFNRSESEVVARDSTSHDARAVLADLGISSEEIEQLQKQLVISCALEKAQPLQSRAVLSSARLVYRASFFVPVWVAQPFLVDFSAAGFGQYFNKIHASGRFVRCQFSSHKSDYICLIDR